MIDLRRVAIIFVIAILYAILVNAVIAAFYPEPKYEDYCRQRFAPAIPYAKTETTCQKFNQPAPQELEKCSSDKGQPDYLYDANGCPFQYKGCNYCQRDFDNANQKYSFYFFIFSSILAIIAIGIGLLLPNSNSLNEWIATGFMLGGLITLFFGTFRYYQYLGRYIKPFVILAELLIVIFLSYRKLRDINTIEKTGTKKRR